MNIPTTAVHVGLLECPYHKGWIEFQYHSDDTVRDLLVAVEAQWGTATDAEDRYAFGSRSWALFCKQSDDSYLSLRLADVIPSTQPEASGKDILELRGFAQHAFRVLESHPGLLDVFFLEKFWDVSARKPVEPRRNYTMRLTFRRDYDIPTDREYSVHLLALVAIVGG